MTCLVTGSWTNNGVRYEFYLVEWTLHPNRKWLVISMMSMPLLYQYAYVATPVTTVALRNHTSIRLMIVFIPGSMHNAFQKYKSFPVDMKFPGQYHLATCGVFGNRVLH